jgi:DNA primase
VRLRRTGRNYTGLCPFHNEKTPSFSVNAERGFFYCFGCGAGGTVFNFLMRQESLTFPEAVRSLASRYGVTLPETPAPGPGANERDAIFRANEVAAAFFSHVLWNTPEGAAARAYLGGRGVADEAARTFALGFAPARSGSLARALERRGLIEPAVRGGLVRREAGGLRELFSGRLIFPIHDGQGRVVAFGGRVLDSRLPKYINSPESPIYTKSRSIYGIHQARNAAARVDRVIVVEGYLDAISVAQAGFKEVVASLGTALTVDQLRILGRYTRNVIACFDGDDAGRKASVRALEVFLAAGLLGRGAFLPAGFDPDTIIRERGAEAFTALIGSSELLVDFFVRENARVAGTSVEGKARAAARVAETLRLITNPFEFDLLARKAAEQLGVDEQLLRKTARPAPKTRPSPGGSANGSPGGGADAAAEAEAGITAIAIACPDLRPQIAAREIARAFDDKNAAELLDQLCSFDEMSVAPDQLMAERLSDTQRGRIGAIIISVPMDDPVAVTAMLDDYCAALRRRGAGREAAALTRSAREAGGDEAKRQVQELIRLRRGRAV